MSADTFSNKCRICLQFQHDSEMNPFFTVYFEGFSLAQLFTNITSYEFRDDEEFPKYICGLCKRNIINFNNMMSIFQNTENLLKKQLCSSEIKSEIEIDEESDENNVEDSNYVDGDDDVDDIEVEYDPRAKIEASVRMETDSKNPKKSNNELGSGKVEYKSVTSLKYTCDCGDCFLHKTGFRQHMQFRHNRLLEESDFSNFSAEIKLKIPVGFPVNTEYVPSRLALRKTKLQCRVCEKSFPTQKEVKKHEEIHKSYICDHCGAAFLKKSYLSDHLRVHSEERRYTCKICEKTFKHRYTYSVHKISHDVTRNFVCDTCGAGFKTRGTLRTHMRIKHSTVRDYSCPSCQLRFNLKSTLDKHFKRKHTANREKSFVCSKCGAAYLNKNTLTRHVAEKHLGMGKLYPCTICESKVYVVQKGLRTHMLKKHGIVYQ